MNHRLTYYSSSSVKGHKLACHLLVPHALRITTTEAIQELTDSALYDPEKPQHTVFSSQSSRYFELHKTCQVCVSFTVNALLLPRADTKKLYTNGPCEDAGGVGLSWRWQWALQSLGMWPRVVRQKFTQVRRDVLLPSSGQQAPPKVAKFLTAVPNHIQPYACLRHTLKIQVFRDFKRCRLVNGYRRSKNPA